MNINYQKELEKVINKNISEDKIPTLLLHSCCAPCSSYVLEYLSQYFNITVFYYNPNIYPSDEYYKRVKEQKEFIGKFKVKNPVKFIEEKYDTDRFYNMAKGHEQDKEGTERCFLCYRLRLEETIKIAKENNFDYFTTVMSVSRQKNSQKLNEIGEKLSQKYPNTKYFYSDFKLSAGFNPIAFRTCQVMVISEIPTTTIPAIANSHQEMDALYAKSSKYLLIAK